jgi:hypothetical protein
VADTRYLPRRVERLLRRLLRGGATRDEAAAAAGITRSLLDTRLRDQLSDLRVGRGRRERDRTIRDPTPEQIRQRAAAIRATWSDEEAESRRANFHGPPD